jgi:multiple sugar transport system permease protein
MNSLIENHTASPAAGVVQASPEVLAIHRQMKRRQRRRRMASYLVAILIALWILVPIWLIASMALTTPQEVRAYPKGVLPFIPFSLDTLRFFLNSYGIIPGIINSVVVAVITLVLSTAIAAPAGYALSRYIFPGRNSYRLAILAVRAFPIVILAIPLAVVFINIGIYDSVCPDALTLPTTVHWQCLRQHSIRARGSGHGLWLYANQGFSSVSCLVLPGIAAAAVFTFVMSWNEVFAASVLTVQNRTLPAQVLATLNQSSQPYQFAGAFFMLVPSMIFIFIIRRYLFNMWGQISK